MHWLQKLLVVISIVIGSFSGALWWLTFWRRLRQKSAHLDATY